MALILNIWTPLLRGIRMPFLNNKRWCAYCTHRAYVAWRAYILLRRMTHGTPFYRITCIPHTTLCSGQPSRSLSPSYYSAWVPYYRQLSSATYSYRLRARAVAIMLRILTAVLCACWEGGEASHLCHLDDRLMIINFTVAATTKHEADIFPDRARHHAANSAPTQPPSPYNNTNDVLRICCARLPSARY